MAGRRVAEEHRDRRFVGAGLEEAQRGQPQGVSLEGKLELPQAQRAALVAAGRKHDLLARLLLPDQPRLDARGGIGIEPDRKRTGLEPRALRVQHDDGGEVLVRQAQRVAANLHGRARRQTLPGPVAFQLEAVAEGAHHSRSPWGPIELHVGIRGGAERQRTVAGEIVPGHRRQRTLVRVAERRQRALSFLQQRIHVQGDHSSCGGERHQEHGVARGAAEIHSLRGHGAPPRTRAQRSRLRSRIRSRIRCSCSGLRISPRMRPGCSPSRVRRERTHSMKR